MLNIKVTNANGLVTIKIYNLSGKMIHKANVSNTEQETVLSIGNQPQGIYILQVKNFNCTVNKKVIKN